MCQPLLWTKTVFHALRGAQPLFLALFGVKTLSEMLFPPPLKKTGYGARYLRARGALLLRMASSLPPGGLKHQVGEAATAEELRSCKIGGCCGKDTPLLPLEQVKARLSALPRWRLSEDEKAISKEFVAKNWAASMSFFNFVSEIAEDEGHHPDFHLTDYRRVRLVLTTHHIGGLSLPDLVLAAKIEKFGSISNIYRSFLE